MRNIAQLFPGSKSFLHNEATIDKFKTSASRFPFLHLATHGCFQPEGCQKLGMEANTLLFADRQLNIADAALLGLQNTELLSESQKWDEQRRSVAKSKIKSNSPPSFLLVAFYFDWGCAVVSHTPTPALHSSAELIAKVH